LAKRDRSRRGASDAFFDDRIAVLSDSVPQTLDEGVWRLENGKTSVALIGHCIQ